MCGAAAQASAQSPVSRGLSPRVRGSRAPCLSGQSHRGSIPACAGQPSQRDTDIKTRRVYPRVCGAACGGGDSRGLEIGLSPRVRGSHRVGHVELDIDRSIPACAGQPRRRLHSAGRQEVYPRVCGAAAGSVACGMTDIGLSPRVRGSLFSKPRYSCSVRSIPACAGQPIRRRRSAGIGKVYPRVCGAAYTHPKAVYREFGLSPRVRGSPPIVSGR